MTTTATVEPVAETPYRRRLERDADGVIATCADAGLARTIARLRPLGVVEGGEEHAMDENTLPGLQDELRLVEQEIDEARRTAAELRAWIGGRAEGVTDTENQSAAITQAEEQEELLGILATRRERIERQIRALSGAGR